MHAFFPGAFFFLGPALLFFGLFKLVFFVLLIVLVVRLITHGRGHAAYAHGCASEYGHGYGHRHGYDAQDLDPRRVAAWRYAAGKIDRAEFDRVVSGIDAAASAPTTPPSAPTPPVA